jgi:DNA-binding NtrC family response regulator
VDGYRQYDPSSFPPAKKLGYKIMKSQCTKCHSLDRVVQAIQTGIAPYSWQPFDQDSAKTYDKRVVKNANSSMAKEEVNSVIDLLQWLISEENGKHLIKSGNYVAHGLGLWGGNGT